MKIMTIFAPCLYAVKYENDDFDELERLFDEWEDVEALEQFFIENEQDLRYFHCNVYEAIIETKKEAKEFRKLLLSLVKLKIGSLDSIFKNLDDNEYRVIELSKQKSKRRWLRIYALRIDVGIYLITGGAIKLTHKMDERLHTKKELNKLELCKNYLRKNNVFDCDSFHEMINDNYEDR